MGWLRGRGRREKVEVAGRRGEKVGGGKVRREVSGVRR